MSDHTPSDQPASPVRPPRRPPRASGSPAPAPRSGLNLSNFVSGLAIGAVVTLLATLAVVPDTGDGDGSGSGEFAFVPGDGTGEFTVGEDGGVVANPGASGGPRAGSAAGKSGRGVNTAGGGGPDGGGPAGEGGGPGGGGGGGGTTTGVTDNSVKFGATIVRGGFAEAFLGEVWHGMEAVRKKVNRENGVEGRTIEIVYQDDEWDSQRGKTFIENLINQEKVFALAVSPSSEGLNTASEAGVFTNSGVPVVGADGLNRTQFKDPFIWPVAAATTTTVDVIMKEAWDRCERTAGCGKSKGGPGLQPAIVFGNTYRFGVEGAYAFNAAYEKLANQRIDGYKDPLGGGGGGCESGSRFCGVSAAQKGGYGTQIGVLTNACSSGTKCNFLLLLLEPSTAQAWMGDANMPATDASTWSPNSCCGVAGAQPLFTRGFAETCGEKCNQMRVWTGYNPPLEQFAKERYGPNREYVEDLKAQSNGADEFNQFTQGGYVGMRLLVEALKQVGRDLTRERLVETLNTMAPFDIGLTTTPLQWTKDSRYANRAAQAFTINALGQFNGWEFAQAAIEDPWLGQHSG